jgi:hypothetical protein
MFRSAVIFKSFGFVEPGQRLDIRKVIVNGTKVFRHIVSVQNFLGLKSVQTKCRRKRQMRKLAPPALLLHQFSLARCLG